MRISQFLLPLCLFILFKTQLSAQSESESALKATIIQLFDGMRQQDTNLILQTLAPGATLQTTKMDKNGLPTIAATPIKSFLARIAGAKGHLLDEIVTSWDVKQDGHLASVWVDYLFYYDGNFSHCGVDAFQMAKIGTTWKIVNLMDTRNKQGCIQDNESEISSTLNAWHHAAAVADEKKFFETMTEDGIYIGTDATEHWLRDTMALWAQPYFDKESAWDFTTKKRNIFVDDDGKIAWFDELLDTWMGICRGSGVMVLVDGQWKIKHYHLAITVPNEVVDEYLKLIGK